MQLWQSACYENGVAYFEIGDAAGARRALNATREGFDAALKFDDPQEHAYALRPKKIVFVTGATGTMGQETMKQLLSRSNRFITRILARPSAKNKELLKKYRCPALEIVWGDMVDYDTIKKCVDGADYVLHIGAMVSPAADAYPEKRYGCYDRKPPRAGAFRQGGRSHVPVHPRLLRTLQGVL